MLVSQSNEKNMPREPLPFELCPLLQNSSDTSMVWRRYSIEKTNCETDCPTMLDGIINV